MDISKIEITQDMIEDLVTACLYNEDEGTAIRKYIDKKITDSELNSLVRLIKSNPQFEETKKALLDIEKAGLIEEDMGTMILKYNRILKRALKECKYEVAARILKEIRQLKAIDNSENTFKIIFEVQRDDKEEEKEEE